MTWLSWFDTVGVRAGDTGVETLTLICLFLHCSQPSWDLRCALRCLLMLTCDDGGLPLRMWCCAKMVPHAVSHSLSYIYGWLRLEFCCTDRTVQEWVPIILALTWRLGTAGSCVFIRLTR